MAAEEQAAAGRRPPDTLLATKLLSPPQRPQIIARERLVVKLRQGQRGPLTLLSAPAGAGKTTAVSTWLLEARTADPQTPDRFAWLSLDADDNDPALFWSYVCAACERLAPGAGAAALSLARSPQPAPLPVIVATLINSLAALPPAAGPERPYALVLDDYHLIENPDIHASLIHLIERLPPQVHLAITARADPPLPLARLRARGLLTELRAADLRFTPAEARELIAAATGLRLDEAAIEALETRTEGWAAGLQLAALALSDQPDPARFVAAFAGSHRYIVDYLADEVLAQQPPHIREFLLRTAVLDEFCGSLCDAVLDIGAESRAPGASAGNSGASFSQHLLRELERKNLFLVPLDDQRRWYRYHHLFAEVLRARLYELAPEAAPTLHRRAAAWYARAVEMDGPARLDAAARHALAGGDDERAAGLIEDLGETLLRHGAFARLASLIQALPPARVQASPSLAILLARARFGRAEPEAVPPLLDAAAAALPAADLAEDERRALRAWIVALDSHMLRVRGHYAEAIARAREARALISAGEPTLRGFATMGLALALHMGGELAAAVEPYREALQLLDADDLHTAITTRCLAGLLYQSLGRWEDASAAYDEALARARPAAGASVAPLPVAGWAMIGQGTLAYERDELAEAARRLGAGIALAEQGEVRDALPFGYAALALLRQAEGRPAEARAVSERFLRFAAESLKLPLVANYARAVAARLALLQGDLAAAEHWARQYTPPPGPLFLSEAFVFATWLQVAIAAGRAEEALGWIIARLPQAAASGDARLTLELAVLRAQAERTLGRPTAAGALDEARRIAAPMRARRIFLDASVALSRARPGPAPHAPADLLATHGASVASPNAPPLEPLHEPLTAREQEILHLIAEGRSNQEIADLLVVGVGTVKTHLHHLYGKLAARDRTHAVARARALGLLA